MLQPQGQIRRGVSGQRNGSCCSCCTRIELCRMLREGPPLFSECASRSIKVERIAHPGPWENHLQEGAAPRPLRQLCVPSLRVVKRRCCHSPLVHCRLWQNRRLDVSSGVQRARLWQRPHALFLPVHTQTNKCKHHITAQIDNESERDWPRLSAIVMMLAVIKEYTQFGCSSELSAHKTVAVYR